MDDIVKILLGLLFLGFSIYNSSRKKKLRISKLAQQQKAKENKWENEFDETKVEPQTFNDTSNEDLSFFEVFKKEVFENIDTSQPSTPINYEEENVEITEEQEHVTEPEPTTEYNEHKTHSALTIDDDDFIDFDELNAEEEVEKFDFDLEKAVIYSEILKPKYF